MIKNKRKGFTLVELLVVISILAILSTVSVVGYTAFIEKARVSNDNTLVSQLNTYIEAHKVLNTTPIEDGEDIAEILENEDSIGEINIQSKQDGYDIYFNTLTEKFELWKKIDAQDKLHLIPSDDWNKLPTEAPDSTKPTLPEVPNEPGETTKPEGSTEPEAPEEPEESKKDISISLKEFIQDEDDPSSDKDTYVYSDDDQIYVGVYTDEDSKHKFVTLNVNKEDMFDYENCDQVSLTSVIHQTFSYEDVYTEIWGTNDDYQWNENSIEFHMPGIYTLTFLAKNNETNEEKVLTVDVMVANICIPDVTVVTQNMNPKIIDISNGIKIQLMDGIKIYENDSYAMYGSYTWNKNLTNPDRSKLYEEMDIEIYINNSLVTYELQTDSSNNYFAIINDDLPMTIESCYIKYGYQGLNGVWVYKEVNVKIN